jgi:hypothetical protein
MFNFWYFFTGKECFWTRLFTNLSGLVLDFHKWNDLFAAFCDRSLLLKIHLHDNLASIFFLMKKCPLCLLLRALKRFYIQSYIHWVTYSSLKLIPGMTHVCEIYFCQATAKWDVIPMFGSWVQLFINCFLKYCPFNGSKGSYRCISVYESQLLGAVAEYREWSQ